MLTPDDANRVSRGTDFVFDSGLQKIASQLERAESLDTKMGVLIGFLGALIAGLLAVAFSSEAANIVSALWWPTRIISAVGIVLIVVSLVCAYQAFKSRRLSDGISFMSLTVWANEDPETTKGAFLSTLRKFVEDNDEQLKRKQSWAGRAIRWTFATLIILWASLVCVGAQFLLGRKA